MASTPLADAGTGDEEHPQAREGLDVNEVADGLVIYDVVSDQVHYLNWSAGAVFSLCDGSRDIAELAQEVQDVFGLEEAPVAAVRETVEQLRSQALVR